MGNIIDRLIDEDSDIVIDAVQEVKELEDPSVVITALLPKLADSNRGIHERAMLSLDKLDWEPSPRDIQTVVSFLNDDNRGVRNFIFRILSLFKIDIQNPRDIETVVWRLGDEDSSIRRSAMLKIVSTGKPALPLLLSCLRSLREPYDTVFFESSLDTLLRLFPTSEQIKPIIPMLTDVNLQTSTKELSTMLLDIASITENAADHEIASAVYFMGNDYYHSGVGKLVSKGKSVIKHLIPLLDTENHRIREGITLVLIKLAQEIGEIDEKTWNNIMPLLDNIPTGNFNETAAYIKGVGQLGGSRAVNWIIDFWNIYDIHDEGGIVRDAYNEVLSRTSFHSKRSFTREEIKSLVNDIKKHRDDLILVINECTTSNAVRLVSRDRRFPLTVEIEFIHEKKALRGAIYYYNSYHEEYDDRSGASLIGRDIVKDVCGKGALKRLVKILAARIGEITGFEFDIKCKPSVSLEADYLWMRELIA